MNYLFACSIADATPSMIALEETVALETRDYLNLRGLRSDDRLRDRRFNERKLCGRLILLGSLLIHGMAPGSSLFTTKATSIYAIILGFLLTNIVMYPIGIMIARWTGNVSKIPKAQFASILTQSA